MDEKVNKLLLLDQSIHYFLEDTQNLSNEEFKSELEKKGYIDKAIGLLKKMNSQCLLESMKRCPYVGKLIDFKKFVRKYPINKAYLRNNQEMYIEEYKKLQNVCYSLSDISKDIQEFQDYINILDINGVEKYLLKHMPNEQIYALANTTTIWHEKLYFFSYFKKEI